MGRLEQTVHEVLSDRRVLGYPGQEWFKTTLKDTISAVIQAMEKEHIDDPETEEEAPPCHPLSATGHVLPKYRQTEWYKRRFLDPKSSDSNASPCKEQESKRRKCDIGASSV